jgi:tetratricopeptide (TPR) repeat protein
MNLQQLEVSSVELAKRDLKAALLQIEKGGSQLPPYLKAGLRSRAFEAADNLVNAEAELRPFLKHATAPWQVRYLYARYLSKRGKPKAALEVARSAYEDSDDNHDALIVYLHTLLDSSEYTEALDLIGPRLDNPQTPKSILLAGASCYRASGDLIRAVDLADRILRDSPGDQTALRLKADSIAEEDSIAGISLYDEALRAAEQSGSNGNATKWNMSLHLLRTRDFTRGWEFWELGSTKEVGTMGRVLPFFLQDLPKFNARTFNPESWTVIVAEQGIGDQVLFLSALNDFLKINPKVILVCDQRMTPIMTRSFPSTVVVKPGFLDLLRDLKGLPMNGYLPMGSLLPMLRKRPEDFLPSRAQPFLLPKPSSVERFKNFLLEQASGRPIIGISWKGGFWQGQKRNKSLSLAEWEPIFESRALIVNLQYGDVEQEIAALNPTYKRKFVTFPKIDFKKDLESWLAIACACDGIVSISTALVHFAAASGVTTKIVMPVRQGPWILGLEDKGHLAYAAAHIYRREGSETFSDLLQRVANMIE